MFQFLTLALFQFATVGQPANTNAIGSSGWGNDVATIGSSGWGNDVAAIGSSGWGNDVARGRHRQQWLGQRRSCHR